MNKHELPPIDWNRIEPRIREHVKFLRDAGFNTTGSCGHDMWIVVDIEPSRIDELSALLDSRYPAYELTFTIHRGFGNYRSARVQFGGDLAGDEKPFDLVLLKVDPESHPLYFVVSARRWPHSDGDPGSEAYFYDEHTCPTNWMRDVIAVISDGDEDPHGFATFVKKIAPPDGMDAGGDINGDCNTNWTDIFPELRA